MKAYDFIEELDAGKFLDDTKHETIVHQEKNGTITVMGSVVVMAGIVYDAAAITGEYIVDIFNENKNVLTIHTEDFEVMKK